MRAIAIAGCVMAILVFVPGARSVPPLRTAFPRITTEPMVVDWKAKAHYWHGRFAKSHRLLVASEQRRYGLRRTLLHTGSVVEAINLACTVYGNCSTLWRKARCETGGTLSPRSKNRHSSASGLFQFLTSTWAGTPFGRYSIWSPYANALGAGWMHANGRGGEWVCR